MNTGRAMISVVLLSFSNVIYRAVFVLIGIWITRFLGPVDAGIFFSAYAFAGLFAIIPDFGVSPMLVREAARDPVNTSRYYGAGLGLFVLSGSAVYAIMAASGYLVYGRGIVASAILLLGINIVAKAGEQVANTALQLRAKLHITAIIQVLVAAASLALLYWATSHGASVLVLCGILGGLGIAGCLLILTAGASLCFPKFSKEKARRLLSESYLFGLSGVLANVYLWAGAVILSKLATEEAVGQYSAAFRLVTVFYLLPTVVFLQVLAPTLFRLAKTDPEKLSHIYQNVSRVMLFAGVGAALVLGLLAKPIIVMVFGDEFAPGATALIVLAWVVPLRFLASASGAIIAVTDLLRLKIALQSVVVGLAIVLTFTFTRRWGYTGTAAAVAVVELSLTILYWWGARRAGHDLRIFSHLRLHKLVLATIPAGAAILWLGERVPAPVAAIAGLVSFLAAGIALRFIDLDDVRLIIRPRKG